MTNDRFETIHANTLNLLVNLNNRLLEDPRTSESEQLLEQLTVAVEELSVVSEEMSQQNSELIETQDELARQIVRYRHLFDTAPVAYLLTDRAGLIVLVNSAAGKILNSKPRSLEGRPLAIYVAQRQLFAAISELGGKAEHAHIERVVDVIASGGRSFTALVSVCHYLGSDNEKDLLQWTIQDRDYLRQLDEYAIKFQLCQDFVNALMHDLKVPVIGAQRILEQLQDGTVAPELREVILAKLATSNEKLLESINTLLDIYNISSISPEVYLQAAGASCINLQEILEDCLHTVSLSALSKNISINTNCADNLPPFFAVSLDLTRMVLCLVDNAIKYSAPDSSIDVRIRQEHRYLIVEVEDYGSGISAADQLHIFERFWQGGQGNRYPSSYGLGLYLSNKIAELYQGTLQLTSEVGAGSCFTARLVSFDQKPGQNSP